MSIWRVSSWIGKGVGEGDQHYSWPRVSSGYFSFNSLDWFLPCSGIISFRAWAGQCSDEYSRGPFLADHWSFPVPAEHSRGPFLADHWSFPVQLSSLLCAFFLLILAILFSRLSSSPPQLRESTEFCLIPFSFSMAQKCLSRKWPQAVSEVT